MATYATAAYPAPYQQQPHHPRNYVPRPPPPNWVPPPFNGPPPIPSGITVNPQQWQAGFWKPNPAWNGARPTAQQQQQQQQQQQPQPQHTLWIPSQHWTHQQQKQQKPGARPQQQQAANFNPFKRVIHPPSAEYLATKLSDNPLGLIDMKPATIEEYYKQGQPVEEQHTPWIWNPAHLEDEDDESTSPSRRNSEPESFTSQLELKPTFSPGIVRTPQHYRDTPSPTVRRPSRASIDSTLSAQMATLSTKPSISRNSTMPSLSNASSFDSDLKPPSMPSMFLSTQLFDEPDSMLSPLIIANTPKPLPPHSLSRINGVRNNHPNPILATQSLDTIPEAPSSHYRVAANESTHTTPKPRSRDVGPSPPHVNNLPTSPTHGYQQAQVPTLPRSQTDWQEVKKQREREQEYREREQERVEREQRKQQREQREREQREREQHDRDLQERERERERIERERREQRSGIGSRHTVTAYVDPFVNTSTKHSPGYSARPSPTSGSVHPSPTHYTPPRQVQAQTTPPSAQHPTSPANTTAPRTTNPLPPPPEPSTRVPLTSTPASASTSTPDTPSKTRAMAEPYHPPPQGPEPASYIYKTRHGYWNRRGDHLTPTGYLVYAPPHLANPPDLRIYPPENEGYMDHNGLYTTWCQRPELPASLPRMGKEPELPYEKFVVWVYQ